MAYPQNIKQKILRIKKPPCLTFKTVEIFLEMGE